MALRTYAPYGVRVNLWDKVSPIPAAGTKSVVFGFPPTHARGRGFDIVVQSFFGTNPDAINLQLQVAMDDVDAEYADTGPALTTVAGEMVTITNVVGKYFRFNLVSITLGSGDEMTVKAMVK